MTYLGAFITVAISGIAAAAASWVVGRVVALEPRRRHHDVGAAIFAQIGIMLSVLLAFVFGQVWGEYRTAAQAIGDECAALHGAAILTSALPPEQGQPVIRAISTYAKAVAYDEWPLMADRKLSRAAQHDLEVLLHRAADMRVSGANEVATQSQVISLLALAHANRETRTFQLTAAAPPLLWLMLIAMSVILSLFVVCAGVERVTHMIFAAVFAASVAMVLVVVRMLDLPFEGSLALPNTDFLNLVAKVATLITATPVPM
jgi:hypothetical protein